MCTPSHLPRGSLRDSRSLAGRAMGEPIRLVPVSGGDANSPTSASRSANRCSAASEAVLNPFRDGSLARSDPGLGGGANPSSNPWQALSLPRSLRTRQERPVRQRADGSRARKTPPHKRMDGGSGVNRPPLVVFTLRNGHERQRPGLGTRDPGRQPAERRTRPLDKAAFHPYAVLADRVSAVPDPASAPKTARSTGAGSPDRLHTRATRSTVSRRERRPHPFPCLDHPPGGCRVPRPEARNRGYSYPSGGRVRALQAILWPRIPPDRPPNAQNRRESGFLDSPGPLEPWGVAWPWMAATQSARDPRTSGPSSPRRSRPSSRLIGPSRITATGSSATTGASARLRPGDGARGVEHPAARRSGGGPETGGQRGRGPPPASAGDARSVAPRGKRITRGQNHGRRSRKSNWDCTICHSCHWNTLGPIGSRKRENRSRLAGIRAFITRPCHTPHSSRETASFCHPLAGSATAALLLSTQLDILPFAPLRAARTGHHTLDYSTVATKLKSAEKEQVQCWPPKSPSAP